VKANSQKIRLEGIEDVNNMTSRLEPAHLVLDGMLIDKSKNYISVVVKSVPPNIECYSWVVNDLLWSLPVQRE
jgi:hypothetical protein